MENEGEDGGHGGIGMLPICVKIFDENDKDHSEIIAKLDKMSLALFGPDGTTGLVEEIRQSKFMDKVVSFIGLGLFGIFTSVVTAMIIKGWV